MDHNAGLLAILKRAPVIPVLTVHGPDDAVPLAQALVDGGLPVLEVTLRTGGALKAIEAIAHAVPDAIVGAGTVLSASQVEEARSAGSRFLVSPGSTLKLAEAATHAGIPLLPGVATASEAMAMAELGYHVLKFFPAEPAGGVAYLKSLSAPLPHLMFCPTGGIDETKAKSYLALPNVVCVGGSWITPADAVKAGEWKRITELAKACASLR
ncbi:MAG: bifunctional 4-hydroxy-2-oxoglutarate aldolase/2-dehydro-3-deoxy-phosphogluconate aldolase [Hyphomicrobiales bacterium]|jgi:2-dehydro-3-deoxyphosphogluconate aldolase/(4S)-4-hydroxy-2-oxoglutarate aldolase|nr:bifunctional 4-hydroxy-2-oxoglutarate aldolase/2-dehydro-3-deoxy-phosphogluconate aldolase [Hyphomicrobiales bacterium]